MDKLNSVAVNIFISFVDSLERFSRFLATVGLFSIIILMLFQVIGRYIFDNPLSWSEELCRYIFVWTSILGGSIGLRKYELIAVDIIINKIPLKYKTVSKSIIYILIIWFSLLFIKHGMILLEIVKKSKVVSPALTIPMYWIYYIFPLGGAMFFIFSCTCLIEKLIEKE